MGLLRITGNLSAGPYDKDSSIGGIILIRAHPIYGHCHVQLNPEAEAWP